MTSDWMAESHRPIVPRELDVSQPHPARRYDYWLGGKDNFAADRASADTVAAAFPTIRLAAVHNRRFLRRAVRYLVAEQGIRQFLDIGTGLPSAGNVHEVAQGIAPEARVVYVDNDPIVLVHARALLAGTEQGATSYLDADLREPATLLEHPDLAATLDLSRPVALLMVAVLHFVTDDLDPYGLVGTYRDVLAPGSHLVVTHATGDHLSPAELDATNAANQRSGVPFRLRSKAEFAAFFDGLELAPPGICSVLDWRPDEETDLPTVEQVSMYGAVARV